MLSFSWRYVYLATFALRFVLALSESYIHPDEHFQSFEVLAQRILGFNTNPPWEFDPAFPARSLAPLYLVYYVPLKVFSYCEMTPLQMWFLMRLIFMLVSWVAIDWSLYKMLPSKQERIKAIFYVLTSYVTLVYQSHTFSNSIETVLVVVTTWMINELRFLKSTEKQYPAQFTPGDIVRYSAVIGCCFALGIFNRITFPAFFVLPSLYYLQCCWRWPYVPLVSAVSFAALAAIFIVIDTIGFSNVTIQELLQSPFQWSRYIITPLNSLLYNSQYLNLAQHGIHPVYTHIIVNIPQILGPGLFLLFPNLRNSYWRTTPFLAAMSGILFLSAVPHQELRFLIPVIPLLCSCFDVATLTSVSGKKTWIPSAVMVFWLFFNALMCFVMGTMHQGGVVPALAHIHESFSQGSTSAYIWWRTYTPPTWMVGDITGVRVISLTNENLEVQAGNAKVLVVDAQGMEFSNLNEVIFSCKTQVDNLYVVLPVASVHLFDEKHLNKSWSHGLHLDLDHLDFSDKRSLQPGLGIYHLL